MLVFVKKNPPTNFEAMTDIIEESVTFSKKANNFEHYSHIFASSLRKFLHVFQAYIKHRRGWEISLSGL